MPSEPQQQERGMLERGAIGGIKELFKKEGLEFTESDLPALQNFKPEKPPFPLLIFLLAVTKDTVDLFVIFPDLAGLTVIGIIFTISIRMLVLAFTIIVTTIFWIWMLGKISGLARFGIRGGAMGVGIAMKSRFVKARVAQGTIGFITESVLPYIPFTTIFVILAHHHENKYVKLFIDATEQYGRALKGKRVTFGNSKPKSRQQTLPTLSRAQRNSEFEHGETQRMRATSGAGASLQRGEPSRQNTEPRTSLMTRPPERALPAKPSVPTQQPPRPSSNQDIGAQPLFRQAPSDSTKK